jgi:hypothetical protein
MSDPEKREFILYDGRAAHPGADTSEASILVLCEDDEEACSYRGDYGDMGCWSYRREGSKLVDEQFEWNWFPGMPK